MDLLPLDVIRHIYSFLPPSDRFNCLFVCQKFLAAFLTSHLPSQSTFRVNIGQCPCRGGVSSSEAWLQVCQCHQQGAHSVLRHIFPRIASAVKSLELEDELATGQISDESLYALLAQFAEASLTRLSFSKCDLAQVRPWTMALISQFNRLNELSVDDCIIPLSEAQFLRSIAPAFTTLSTVEIKNSRQVTDKFARNISRNCPLLETFRVSGCPSVTALSALALIETAGMRVKPAMTMYAEETSFDADHLYRLMNSSLFGGLGDWRLRPAVVSIGYDRSTLLVEHRQAMCVLIYV